jgi:chemotaxis protein histidine kinase CheA
LIQQSFIEETQELIQKIQMQLQRWFDQRTNRSLLLELQRDTHTIKGAARMAGVQPVIDITTALENTFEQFALRQFSSNVYDGLLLNIVAWLQQAIQSNQYDGLETLKQQLTSIEFIDVSAQLPQQASSHVDFANNPFAGFIEGDGTEPPSMLGEWDTENTTDQNNEMIRISAGLVETMINLTGENAINRSRIEMESASSLPRSMKWNWQFSVCLISYVEWKANWKPRLLPSMEWKILAMRILTPWRWTNIHL